MLKNSFLKKINSDKILIFFLILHIALFVIILLDLYKFFSSLTTSIAISKDLIDINYSIEGLTFITNSQSFYFKLGSPIYLIIFLVIDVILLISLGINKLVINKKHINQ